MMDIQNFKNIVISGASSTIGFHIASQLQQMNPKASIVGLTSNINKIDKTSSWDQLYEVDYLDQNSLIKAKKSMPFDSIDLLIFCNGFLHCDEHGPEKRLEDCDPTHLLKSFEVNVVSLLMVAKILKSMFKHKRRSGFFALSAMVGSISDNRLGGWYGYRSSKAAMNMCLKNISIEFGRSNYHTSVHGIHPGTTLSPLSQPFIAGRKPDTIYTPALTAKRILQVIEQSAENSTGEFYHWDGHILTW